MTTSLSIQIKLEVEEILKSTGNFGELVEKISNLVEKHSNVTRQRKWQRKHPKRVNKYQTSEAGKAYKAKLRAKNREYLREYDKQYYIKTNL